jgi:hypothetical protein
MFFENLKVKVASRQLLALSQTVTATATRGPGAAGLFLILWLKADS